MVKKLTCLATLAVLCGLALLPQGARTQTGVKPKELKPEKTIRSGSLLIHTYVVAPPHSEEGETITAAFGVPIVEGSGIASVASLNIQYQNRNAQKVGRIRAAADVTATDTKSGKVTVRVTGDLNDDGNESHARLRVIVWAVAAEAVSSDEDALTIDQTHKDLAMPPVLKGFVFEVPPGQSLRIANGAGTGSLVSKRTEFAVWNHSNGKLLKRFGIGESAAEIKNESEELLYLVVAGIRRLAGKHADSYKTVRWMRIYGSPDGKRVRVGLDAQGEGRANELVATFSVIGK